MQRLFVALPVPEAVIAAIEAAQAQLRAVLPGNVVRWQNPANSHLTLLFLGNVADEMVAYCRSSVRAAAAAQPPFALHTAGIGTFPSPLRPSVLWLGVAGDVEALFSLHRRLRRDLEGIGEGNGGKRFTPHLTLARIRRPGAQLRRDLGDTFADALLQAPEPVAWQADALALYASSLTPGGARHTVLELAPLGTDAPATPPRRTSN